MYYSRRWSMATAINLTNQEYFLKMAPDLSVFELFEKYYYDNDLSEGVHLGVFSYEGAAGQTYVSDFHRAMFKVYTSGNITVSGMEDDEYCVIPYTEGVQIVVATSESQLTLVCDQDMDLILGVAF
jgi:hypothetical protein